MKLGKITRHIVLELCTAGAILYAVKPNGSFSTFGILLVCVSVIIPVPLGCLADTVLYIYSTVTLIEYNLS